MDPKVTRGRRTLKLSNLDKPFWPRRGSRRASCSRTTATSRARSCPHLRERPFTMKRYPDGWEGKSFFQKQAPSHMPDWIATAAFPASTREGEQRVIDYALVDDELALLWVVNMGCIDMHAWASRRQAGPAGLGHVRPRPVRGRGFEDVIEVALLVRRRSTCSSSSRPEDERLARIHVLVPITAATRLRRGARVRRDRRRRSGPRAPGARDDRVDEGEA